MHLLHHVPLVRVWSQNSSKYVSPCAFRGEYTTIGRHRNFLIPLHNHQTKSIVIPSIYCYHSGDFRTIEICVVQNPSMTPVITFVKGILLQCNPFVFSTIFPMSICDMDHYADLV